MIVCGISTCGASAGAGLSAACFAKRARAARSNATGASLFRSGSGAAGVLSGLPAAPPANCNAVISNDGFKPVAPAGRLFRGPSRLASLLASGAPSEGGSAPAAPGLAAKPAGGFPGSFGSAGDAPGSPPALAPGKPGSTAEDAIPATLSKLAASTPAAASSSPLTSALTTALHLSISPLPPVIATVALSIVGVFGFTVTSAPVIARIALIVALSAPTTMAALLCGISKVSAAPPGGGTAAELEDDPPPRAGIPGGPGAPGMAIGRAPRKGGWPVAPPNASAPEVPKGPKAGGGVAAEPKALEVGMPVAMGILAPGALTGNPMFGALGALLPANPSGLNASKGRFMLTCESFAGPLPCLLGLMP
mmetsp:Transcript_69281/g.129375  ORF Transcript_69281/g.129375 Transcript_69281/m.129375 type:complete len:364 (+) Transcript_69281:1689-2780(+)